MHDIICHAASDPASALSASRRRRLPFALAAFSLGLLPALATTQPYYPRIVGSDESSIIDYGPGLLGNIVGGGHVVISGGGDNTTLTRLGPQYAQPPRTGMVPVIVGSGEYAATVWVPAATDPLQQALIGGDGSLPETTSRGTPVRSASRRTEPPRD